MSVRRLENIVHHIGRTHTITERATISSMMHSVRCSVQKLDTGPEVESRMFVQPTQATKGRRTDHKVEISPTRNQAQGQQVRQNDFEEEIERRHVHAADRNATFRGMMDVMTQTSISPTGMQKEPVSDVENHVMSVTHENTVQEENQKPLRLH
mmetsp:Transcript_24920/g.41053  ORF Transcript_24920/g.41053 Transcript_24920/m.41053 type:complete len:153 (+) Transcript_24920:790-1248(+)